MNLGRGLISFIIFVFLICVEASAGKRPCYVWLHKILVKDFQNEFFDNSTLENKSAYKINAAESEIPIVRAFEKEGLLYEDIEAWFPIPKDTVPDKLRQRLKEEDAELKPKFLTRWLNNFEKKYLQWNYRPERWKGLSKKQKLEAILKRDPKFFTHVTPLEQGSFFEEINIEGKNDLFYDGILNFNDLPVAKQTPKFLDVTDDIGSYEVKTSQGIVNLRTYLKLRHKTEEFLDGKVGHQHIAHGWPDEDAKRIEIAPYYIELLDSMTWFLFWRQMRRDPDEVSSLLWHPYLGVYTRGSLNRLFNAMVEGSVAGFKDKYRMVGARVLKADPRISGQDSQGENIPDFELRSGNKGADRKIIESIVMSRITSGDYVDQMNGLNQFNSYEFDPSAPLEILLQPLNLPENQIKTLLEFEQKFSYMEYSMDVRAKNHLRNKVIAPLLRWETRLHFSESKKEELLLAQWRYANELYETAKQYLKARIKATKVNTKSEIKEKAMARIESSVYKFSKKMKLHEDFQNYLIPKPNKVADITIGNKKIDNINLGIEYSFRFPQTVKSKSQAESYISEAVEKFSLKMGGGKIEKQDDGGHGHGLSVRYLFTDVEGRVWRFEWDGVSRSYVKGNPVRPRGGHIEVPTPKFAPQDPSTVVNLFTSMRELGMVPKRTAGGSHFNIDLEPFINLPEEKGAKIIANFIHYFESNRELIAMIWQHPARYRVAIPVEHTPELENDLVRFNGGWNELAEMLYRNQYFNPFIGRKPKYTQLNVTSLLEPVVPNQYLGNSIDIKNPDQKWKPEFPQKTGRIEFRLFDAVEDENKAALQIKYVRALLKYATTKHDPTNLAWDGGLLSNIDCMREFLRLIKSPEYFEAAARAHFARLGLDFNEYHSLVAEAWIKNHNALAINRKKIPKALRKQLRDERQFIEEEEEEEEEVFVIPWSGKSFTLEEEDAEILKDTLEDDVDYLPNAGPMIKYKFLPPKLEKKKRSGMVPLNETAPVFRYTLHIINFNQQLVCTNRSWHWDQYPKTRNTVQKIDFTDT